MKTKFFNCISTGRTRRFAPTAYCHCLLLLFLYPALLSAQNGVTVTNLAVDAGTVTFDVSWDKSAMPVDVWSDSVWVFVDYNDAGTMRRLPLLPGATLTTTSAPGEGKVMEESGNNKGVWVVGNAKTSGAGSFSATVQLLTATATATGACAYASNYPPVGQYTAANKVSFTGTPMYNIVLKNEENDTIYRTSGTDYDIPGDYTLVSFTDATGAPGIMKCILSATYTLNASAPSFCEGSEGVQFALSGTENGRQYQLFRDNTTVDGAVLAGDGNAATFTDSFDEAGIYMAKSVPTAIRCEMVMDKTHLITENPLPTINILTGNTSQTVTVGEAITDIIYITANATGVSVTGLPLGVNGSWSVNTYTISGTINSSTESSTYSYIVTPVDDITGCVGPITTGTITRLSPAFPPYAASAATYAIADLTWSDRINYAPTNCQLLSSCTRTEGSYSVVNNRYHYTWNCFANNRDVMCPPPWRMPYYNDLQALLKKSSYNQLGSLWGVNGCCDGCGGCGYMNYLWGIMSETEPTICEYAVDSCGPASVITHNRDKDRLFQARCVKD
jgi:hypothetical protein